MKKAAICAKDEKKIPKLKEILEDKELEYVDENPDFVISLGGDGTFLKCEQFYPGIPKLLIRDSKICKKCVGDNQETILDFIRMNAYEVQEERKLELSLKGKKFYAVNDVVVRNKFPNQAIRIAVYLDDKKSHEEVIGDGLVISTPFGSTAYYQSITRENFSEGIGIAFNNPIKEHPPIKLRGEHTIRIEILRGKAELSIDNNPDIKDLEEGKSITVKLSDKKARIIHIEGMI